VKKQLIHAPNVLKIICLLMKAEKCERRDKREKEKSIIDNIRKSGKIQICMNTTYISHDRRSANFSCINYSGNLRCSASYYKENFDWVYPAWIKKEDDQSKYEKCQFYCSK